MYNFVSTEEAVKAWELFEGSPSLLVGDNWWVYGSSKALARVQAYILADSQHPVERKDINLYLANELKLSEDKVKVLREEVEALKEQLQAYQRFSRKPNV